MTDGASEQKGDGGETKVTPPTTPPTTTQTQQQQGPSKSQSQTKNNTRYNNFSKLEIGDINTKGENEVFGYVIGTKNEKLTHGKAYNDFKDLLLIYVVSDFKYGDDISSIIRDLKDPEEDLKNTYGAKRPVKDAKDQYADFAVEEWKMEHKMFLDRKAIMKNNEKKLYALVWGQSTQALRSEIIALKDYNENSRRGNVLWLLENIKLVSAGVDTTANVVVTYHQQYMSLSYLRQNQTESMEDYLKRFNALVTTTKLAGGDNIWYCEKLHDKKLQDATEDERKESEEKVKAIFFLMHGDKTRFGPRIRILEEGMHAGRDEWPKTVVAAYHLMIKTQEQLISEEKRVNRGSQYPGRRAQFVQQDDKSMRTRPPVPEGATMVPGVDGTVKDVKCYKCQEWGHFSPNCPNPAKGRSSFLMQRMQLTQMQFTQSNEYDNDEYELISRSWVLLDTCSTDSTCNDTRHVNNIVQCKTSEEMITQTNGGPKRFTKEADLKLFPMKVYFEQESLATVLSYYQVKNLPDFKIHTDTDIEDAINVIDKKRNMIYKFRPCGTGLYFLNIEDMTNHVYPLNVTSQAVTPYSFIQSVATNKELLNKQEIQGADRVLQYLELLGWPSVTIFKEYIRNDMLTNCDITIDDVSRYQQLYGTPVPELKGKLKRVKPQSHDNIKRIPLPHAMEGRHLQIYIDIFYVNKLAFFVSKSRKVNFVYVTVLKSRSAKSLIDAINDHVHKYEARGFEISDIHGDDEFNFPAFERAVRPAILHKYAKNEHVGFIENSNKTFKERARSIVNGLPYTKYTQLMTISLVEHIMEMLNLFPTKDSVFPNMGPSMIVEGRQKLDIQQKRVPFGAYAQVWIGTKNNMTSRAVPGIALRASNDKGGCYFMSLYTGRRINSYVWNELPISDEIVERVEALAGNKPNIMDDVPFFEWHTNENKADETTDGTEGDETQQENDEQENSEDEETMADESVNESVNESVDASQVNNVQVTDDEDETDEESIISEKIEEYDEEEQNNEEIEMMMNENEEIEIEVSDFNTVNNAGSNVAENNNICLDKNESKQASKTDDNADRGSIFWESNPGTDKGIRQSARIKENTRRFNNTCVGAKYSQAIQFLAQREQSKKDKTMGNYMNKLVNVMFTQMNAKKGMKLFKERAVAAMIKEITQLDRGAVDGKPVVIPIDPKSLTEDMKKMALEAVHLIKEKRDGEIKGRTCADGSKQRRYLKDGESVSSPTVSMEGIFLTFLIAAYEGREVVSFDVPGAFLQAEMEKDKFMLLKFRGEFVDMMCEVNAEHKNNVIYENGKKVLYMKIIRGLYGCIEASLQWYKCYTETLEKEGFTLNPYDRCVANKMINGHQCTIAWYVDDNVMTHKDPNVLKNIFNKICSVFGNMEMTSGDTHEFLGMDVKINRTKKNIEVSMIKQLKDIIKLYKDKFGPLETRYTSPAGHHLFDVNEKTDKLKNEEADFFHTVTAKLLYMMKRARPDIELAISFMCTRVRDPSLDDWKKMKRVLGWLESTINDKRIIGANSLRDIYTWIDASYAIHPNMRGHTGGAISMGYGVIHTRAGKQKINTKSSTESELVGMAEYIPYNLWLLMFLEEQGYGIKNNVVYQDNQSAMLLEKNGRNSCTGNSRHINIRYFFVKDRIDKKEIKVEYCPTGLMLADYNTKPLMGAKFQEFREYVMGWKNIADLVTSIEQSVRIKERVGNTKINETQVEP